MRAYTVSHLPQDHTTYADQYASLNQIRNKKNHFLDLPPLLQVVMGPLPQGYLSYWCDRFPSLLIQVYQYVVASRLQLEPRFVRYFPA